MLRQGHGCRCRLTGPACTPELARSSAQAAAQREGIGCELAPGDQALGGPGCLPSHLRRPQLKPVRMPDEPRQAAPPRAAAAYERGGRHATRRGRRGGQAAVQRSGALQHLPGGAGYRGVRQWRLLDGGSTRTAKQHSQSVLTLNTVQYPRGTPCATDLRSGAYLGREEKVQGLHLAREGLQGGRNGPRKRGLRPAHQRQRGACAPPRGDRGRCGDSTLVGNRRPPAPSAARCITGSRRPLTYPPLPSKGAAPATHLSLRSEAAPPAPPPGC